MERLRRAVLACAAIDGADVTIDLRAGQAAEDPAIVVTGRSGASLRLTWADVAAAVPRTSARGGPRFDPGSDRVRAGIGVLVEAATLVCDGGPAALGSLMRVHVEPRGGPRHPGPAWAVQPLPGGAGDAGWGLVPRGRAATAALPASPTLRRLLTGVWPSWRAGRAEVDRLAGVLTERLDRDHRERRPVVLRRIADCDLPTLLLCGRLRRWLADLDGTGLGVLAMPTRSRAWTDVRQVDAEFVALAHAATDEPEQAFRRPLLVTADEVVLPGGIGHVVTGDRLADPPPDLHLGDGVVEPGRET